MYQFFNFGLIYPEESDDGKAIAPDTLREFLSSTGHGGKGKHHAEMMALALAFSGGEVGRFLILPDMGRRRGDYARYVLLLFHRG